MNDAPDPIRPRNVPAPSRTELGTAVHPPARPMFPADAVRDRLRGARAFNDRLAGEQGHWGPELSAPDAASRQSTRVDIHRPLGGLP